MFKMVGKMLDHRIKPGILKDYLEQVKAFKDNINSKHKTGTRGPSTQYTNLLTSCTLKRTLPS